MKRYKKLFVLIFLLSILTAILLVKAAAVSPAYGAGSVSASSLNVRAEPSTTGSITATIPKDSTVVILDITNDSWYHVNYNGTEGYTASMYISGVETAKNFTASGALTGGDIRMRSAPSTSGSVLGTYPSGTIMSIIGINNGWYKVQYDGKTGYIRSDFITLSSGSDSTYASTFSALSSKGQEIAEYASQLVGYKYIYGAASPKTGGFDCSGLVYYTYKQFGYSISRTASQQYKKNGVSISKADLQPGDLVFFSRNGGRSVTHVGLYYGDGMFVNASTQSTGVIMSSLDSAWYTKTWYGAKRITG
jgi:cell wall-associated NlpC family hydrolase